MARTDNQLASVQEIIRHAAQRPRVGVARPWPWTTIVEAVALAVVLVVATVARCSHLMTTPAFTDEALEVLLALDTLASGRLNLVGASSYLGGLHTWLLMGSIAITGGAVEGPRLLSLIAGLLTVLLTYVLGRALGGRWAGLLAAALLATNLPHIVINSRIAWSNCVTPLFITASLVCLTLALRQGRPGWLAPAAAAAGLGLQTHPSAAALLPGLALGVVASPVGRRWVVTRWPWLAAGSLMLAYANVIWFNLTTGGNSLATARASGYAVSPTASPGELFSRFGALSLQFARNLGSSFDGSGGPPTYPITVTMVGVAVLALIGATLAIRRGQWVLPMVLIVSPVLMALIGGEYLPLPRGASRYLGPLWPPALALAGLGAAWLGDRAWRAARAGGRARPAAAIGLACLLGLCAALIGQPFQTARAYDEWYARRPFLGTANQFALDIAHAVAAHGDDGRVYLDTTLHEDGHEDAGTMFRSLDMLLSLEGREVVTLPRARRQTLATIWEQLGRRPGLAVLRNDQVRLLSGEGARLTLIGTASRVVDPAHGPFRLYEVRRP